jgi:hypothetical protein
MANLARQRGRRAWVRRRVTLGESEPLDPAPAPGHDQEQEELELLLQSELATLDEPFRSTLHQHFLGGLQLVQIARRDGVPEGTVRWRLKAGIERLRMRLDVRYGDRRRWLAALLPFAGPRRAAPLAPGAPLGLLAGVGVVLLALLGGAAWFFFDDEDERAEPGPEVAAVRVLAPAAPAATGASSAYESAAPARASEPALFADEFALDVTVLDAEGVAVAGAEVSVHAAGGFEPRARTDPAGRATLRARAAEVGTLGVPFARDRLVLRAEAEGHATSDALFLRAGETRSAELVLAGRERILRGRVSDGSGAPLADVGIHAVLDPARTTAATEESFAGPLALGTTSAADGTYELRGLARRPYAVVVTRARCEPSLVLVNAERDELPLVFVPGGTLRGRIVDERGEPAPLARVWVEPLHRGSDWCAGIPGYRPELRGFALETLTDAEGWYELYDVHPRPRRVRAASATAPLATAGALLSVPAGTVTDWSAFLASEPGQRLHLIDERGADLAGWVVVLVANRAEGGSFARMLVADATGRIECRETAGAVEVLVHGPAGMGEPRLTRRLAPAEEEQTLVVPTETSAHLVGRIPAELLAADPEARVIAYDLGSRQPFTLELEPASGRFRAELDAGRYALLLCGKSGAAWLADVTLARGERRRLGKFTLPEPGQVLLRADRPETLAGNYRLELCFGRNSMKWQEGALPLFGVYTLLAGLYRLDTAGQGGLIESGWVEVTPHGTGELDLTSLARLELELRAGADSDAAKLGLAVFRADSEPRSAPARHLVLQRRPDGSFRHALRLPAGEWTVEIQDEGRALRSADVLMPSSGERSLEL